MVKTKNLKIGDEVIPDKSMWWHVPGYDTIIKHKGHTAVFIVEQCMFSQKNGDEGIILVRCKYCGRNSVFSDSFSLKHMKLSFTLKDLVELCNEI